MAKANQVVTLAMSDVLTRKFKSGLALPQTLTFTVAGVDGEEVVINVLDLPDHILADAIVHGLRQKVSDGAAIPRDVKTGLAAEPSEKFDAMADIAQSLAEGQWNRRATGGGGESSLLVRALIEVTGKSRDDCRAFMKAQSKEAQAALRASAAIAPVIARMKSESVKASGVDGDALLSAFTG